MPSAPTRSRRSTAARAGSRRRSGRGWLTLLALGGLVALVSAGPPELREPVAGLTFSRPVAGMPVGAPHPVAELQSRLDAVLASVTRGQVGAVVVDLESGATASLNAERGMAAASLFKVPILLEVLAQREAGGLDPERRLEIRPEDWTDGSGVLQARVGERLSVRELTRLMIQESDNIAALVLLDAIGVANVNARSERSGLKNTHLVDHRAGEGGEHSSSAADMSRLLVQVVAGQAVSQDVSEQALRLLELKQAFTWLADDLPFWVKVAHKWGDLPEARNDAGIVFSPRGSVVVAILTEDMQPQAAAETIARVARVGYDYLGTRPRP